MGKTNGGAAQSDALVFFSVTGDLAHKMNFPALYAMAKRGVLDVPMVGVAARVKRAGKEFIGDQRDLYLGEEEPGEETLYERLLGNAMAGDGALVTHEEVVEAAWAVVDHVLKTHH